MISVVSKGEFMTGKQFSFLLVGMWALIYAGTFLESGPLWAGFSLMAVGVLVLTWRIVMDNVARTK